MLEIPEIPADWLPALVKPSTTRGATAPAGLGLSPSAREDMIEWLSSSAPPAVEGEGGDAQTFSVARTVRMAGATQDEAAALLAEHYNPRCQPPWDLEALERKVLNAYVYASDSPAVEVQPLLSRVPVPAPFKILEEKALANLQPPRWLVKNFIPRQGFGVLYGSPATYKSFVALDVALTIVTPLRTRPGPWEGSGGRVLYMAGEGVGGLQKRTSAWRAVYSGGAVADGLYVMAGVPTLAGGVRPVVESLEAGEVDCAFDLVVVDTVGRVTQGYPETTEVFGAVTGLVESLQQTFGAAVLLIHHAGKDITRGARGANVLEANADMVIRAETADRRHVKLTTTKAKEWDPQPPRYLELVTEGDSLVPVPSSNPKEAVEALNVERALAARVTVGEAVAQFFNRHSGVYTTARLARELEQAGPLDGVVNLRHTLDELTNHPCWEPIGRRWTFAKEVKQ